MTSMMAKFPGKCGACGGPIRVGEPIFWAKGRGATHTTLGQCDASKALAILQPKATMAPVVTVEASGIVAFLEGARARGIKFPKARFLAPGGGELRLALAGQTAKVPGAVQVKLGDGTWLGRVNPDGTVVGWSLKGDAALLDTLGRIAADPAAEARKYGALMSRCSFCDKPLTDAGSVEAGYGPVCAAHWGLPHTAKGTPALLPVAA